MTKRVRKNENNQFLYYCKDLFYTADANEQVGKGINYKDDKYLINEYGYDNATEEIKIIRKIELYKDIILYNKVEALSSVEPFLKSYRNL